MKRERTNFSHEDVIRSRHVSQSQQGCASSYSTKHRPFKSSITMYLRWCLTVLGLFFLFTFNLTAQSGTAFRDFNGDGSQTGAEPGVEGITVKLYIDGALPLKDELIGTTVTDVNGSYNFGISVTSGRAANPNEQVRVEFEIPASYQCTIDDEIDFIGAGGSNYGTSVQFIEGQESGVDFAINYIGNWVSTTNPEVFVPYYVFGAPGASAAVNNAPAFVKFDFQQGGTPATHSNGQAGVPSPTTLSTVQEVGSLYGVAYSRQANRVFTAAVLRRHAALGPLGSGGIYMVDPSGSAGSATVNFLSLDAIGIATQNAGGSYPSNPGNNTSPVSGYIGTNAERGLPQSLDTPSTDYAAGDQVGKVSLGDIDISDDGRYLYVMNLYDRKVYEIDLVDPFAPEAPTAANMATRVRSWDVPDPGTIANQGEHRPWGLKYYRGSLYVGLVLSGQDAAGNVVSPVNGSGNAQIGEELRGYVYEFDFDTEVFTTRLDFSFNYGRERPWIPWGYTEGQALSRYFSAGQREKAEPIIADIEFDDQGNMLIGVLDRKGHQYGVNNNDYNGSITTPLEYATAGELLRAAVTQNGADCMYSIISTTGTADYYKDNIVHPESLQGPLAVLPGENEALTVVLDPIAVRSGGVIRFDNNTGNVVAGSAYEVFDDRHTSNSNDATISKANGLGDIELFGGVAPIEIGNLVWADIDGDGIQDPGEEGIANVQVELLDGAMTTVIATTMTDVDGGYYFNQYNVNDNGYDGPRPNTDYKVRIAPAQFNNGVGVGVLANLMLTATNESGAGLADRSDNDATLVAGEAIITLTTGDIGRSNHSYDFGFLLCDYGDLPDTYGTTEANQGARHQINATLYLGSCVDAEYNGQPEAMAGAMNNGDDNTAGVGSVPTGVACSDDEDGISFFNSLLPGQISCVDVNITNLTGSTAVLQGWIDWNGDNVFDPTEELGLGFPLTFSDFNLNTSVCFNVPQTAVFNNNEIYARFRLSPNGGLNATDTSADPVVIGEVEDYKVSLAKLGNLVWSD